jgi:hypothetical protein
MPEIEGKATPIDWASFKGRTRLVIQEWVDQHKFRTYADVRSWCVSKGVTPPHPDEVPLPKKAGKKGGDKKKVAPPIPQIGNYTTEQWATAAEMTDDLGPDQTHSKKTSKRKTTKKKESK